MKKGDFVTIPMSDNRYIYKVEETRHTNNSDEARLSKNLGSDKLDCGWVDMRLIARLQHAKPKMSDPV